MYIIEPLKYHIIEPLKYHRIMATEKDYSSIYKTYEKKWHFKLGGENSFMLSFDYLTGELILFFSKKDKRCYLGYNTVEYFKSDNAKVMNQYLCQNSPEKIISIAYKGRKNK